MTVVDLSDDKLYLMYPIIRHYLIMASIIIIKIFMISIVDCYIDRNVKTKNAGGSLPSG